MADPSKTIHKLTAENAALKKKIEELKAADTEIKLQYAYEQLRAQYDSLLESERSLRKSEEKLQSIFRVAPTGIGVVSDRILIEVNSKICAMTGYSSEELVGRSSRIFYPSQKEFEFVGKEKYAQIDKYGTGVLETRWQRKDGKIIDILLSSTPVDPDDLTKGVTFTALDITDRKLAEEALNASQAQLSTALEMAHLGHWEYDVATDLFTFNDHFYKIFRTTVEKVGGYTMHSAEYARRFVHPEDSDMVREETQKAIETTDPHFNRQFEHRILYEDGTAGHITVRFFIVKDSHGQTVKTYGVNQDITDRKRYEEELRASEERYRLLAENTTDVIWTISLETQRFAYVSPSIMQMRGYTVDEAMEMTIEQSMSPESYERAINTIQEELARDNQESVNPKRSRRLELHQPCKDGTYRWAEVTASFIRNAEHAPIQILGVSRDITERKRAEQALKDREEIFSSIVEQAMDAIVLIDGITGRFVEFNTAAHEGLGYTREEFATLGVPDIQAEHSPELIRQNFELTRKQGGLAFETKHLHRDGQIRETRVSIRPLHIKGHYYLAAVWTDITERKRAENALRESEEKYHSLFNQSTEGIYLHDLEGRILDVNEMACAQSGYTREEWLGLTVFDGHPSKSTTNLHKTEILQAWRRWDPEKRVIVEAEQKRKDGTVYPVEISTGMVRYGDVNAMLAIVKDVTERKEAAAQLREKTNLLQHITDHMFDLVALTDLAGTFTFAGPSHRILGFKPAQLIGTSVFDYVHPDDAVHIAREFSESMANPTPDTVRIVEYRHRCADGSYLWMETMGKSLFSDEGFPSSLFFSSRDITKRKLAEEVLKASEENYRAFFSSMQDMIVVGTSEGRILYANDAIIQKLGYSLEELDAIGIFGIHPQDRRQEAGEIFAAMCRGERLSCPLPLQRRDGVLLPVETRVSFGKWNGIDCLFGISKDLTAEQEAMQRFERLFRSNPAPMALSSPFERCFLDVNDAFLETLGYARTEVIGRSAAELGLFPDPEAHRAFTDLLVADGHIAGAELKVRAKDGSLRDGLFSGEVIAGQDRQYFLTVMIDITLRKQVEEDLQKTQLELSAIYSGAPVMISMINKDRRVLYANQAFCTFIGTDGMKVIEERVCGVFGCVNAHQDPRGCGYGDDCRQCTILNGIHNTFHSGEIQRNIEKRMPFEKDGRRGEICLLASTSLVRRPDGPAVLLCMQDITEYKQAEAQLRLQSLVLNQIQDRVTVTDLDGVITYINEAEVRSLGYSRDELIGASTEKYGEDPKRGATQLQIVEETLKHGSWRGEVVNRSTDGKEVILDCRTQLVLDEQGNRVALAGISTDITERKEAEAEREKLQSQLLQAQKMESVGRLAGGVAHDFNNMLGVIFGHTEMAMEQVNPALPLYADLQEIRKAAERSSDLTRQLLAFARKQTVSPKVIDLNKTVDGMLKMLNRMIGEDIHLAWLPGADTWPVKMDPSQIDQILANLCVNARDAIAGVGKVTIETGNVAFDEAYCTNHAGSVPGEYVLLALSDDGCGMDKETLSHLFEPFFTTKDVGKGTGLGLATVYGIVKQNNGFIDVDSEPDQGTTFKVYLPRHIGKTLQEQAEGPQEPVMRGHETVLVVEDEKGLLDLCRRILEKLGYQVLTASTPGEAIRLAEEHTGDIHLLMTDVIMPEMNGRDLAKALLSLYPKIKRLFMSGYTADIIAHHGVLDDGVHFIQKPFTGKKLSTKVRDMLDGE